jgi:hypothetical protein
MQNGRADAHLDRFDLHETSRQERPEIPRQRRPGHTDQVRNFRILIDPLKASSFLFPEPSVEACQEDLTEREGDEESGEDTGRDGERLEEGEEGVLRHRNEIPRGELREVSNGRGMD